MARYIRSVAFLAVAALLVASPAAAQFGSIFSDGPPRPPADVPNAPQSRRPPDQPPYFPGRADSPPQQPLPAPMSLPPSNRPGGGASGCDWIVPPPGRFDGGRLIGAGSGCCGGLSARPGKYGG